MEEKPMAGSHKLLLDRRSRLELSGVLDVISFDLKEILLETADGMLTIKGNDLHMNHLSVDKGEVNVEGRVDVLQYADVVSAKAAGEHLLERLFK